MSKMLFYLDKVKFIIIIIIIIKKYDMTKILSKNIQYTKINTLECG